MLFPYMPRGPQLDIVDFVRTAATQGSNAVFESGTGTGKTVCSLTGALEAISGTNRKLVYVTRTKSQHRQVIQECRKISERKNIVCIGIQGRNPSTCPFMKDDPELSSGTPDELSRLCSDLKRRKSDGCKYYREMGSEEKNKHLRFLSSNHPDAEEFIRYASSENLCPYELMKALLPDADVVVAPYAFLLTPRIRQHFLNWMNVHLEDLVIIADEAHNIPDYLREVMTTQYSEYGLRMTVKEAQEWNDPEIYNGISVTDLTTAFSECISDAISEYLVEDDGLVPPYFLEEGLMSSLSVSSVALDKMYKTLDDIGNIVSERKRLQKKLPRSYMGSLGRFLQSWTMCDEEMYVKLITAPPNASFESYCMDPFPAAEPFRVCYSSIHMSGTLQPLDQYGRMLGLNAAEQCFPSPFDPANLLTLYVDDSSTKYDEMIADPGNMARLQDHTIKAVVAEKRNSAVFFPSYSMMERFIGDGVLEKIGKEIYYERQGTDQTELMGEIGKFRISDNAVLFAVAGGRVSEGIDFPDKDLEIAVLVGIPYPKPNAKLSALTRYCDIRYGDGWGQAVRSPTIRKMRQTIGRLIRSETDRGVAVILDKRAAAIKELNAVPSEDPSKDMISFFAQPTRKC